MTETSTNIGAGVQSSGADGLLAAELQHRIKNLYAVIQALARRSLNGDSPLEEARDAFIGRLEALARADQRFIDAAWIGTSLNDLVRSELRPFADRIKVEGADVTLNSQGAQSFALALHELATNASKYGALSSSGGAVSVEWSAGASAGDGALKFRWQERGGPPVSVPKQMGFGTSLLNAALGEGRLDYAIEGLTYEVDVPFGMIVTHERPTGDRDKQL